MAKPMTLLELRDAIAKAIADAIGHGMREKCERHADAVLAVVGTQLLATTEQAERIEADEGVVTDGVVRRAAIAYRTNDTMMRGWQPDDRDLDRMRAALLAVWPTRPVQAAQVESMPEIRAWLADYADELDEQGSTDVAATIRTTVASLTTAPAAEPVAHPTTNSPETDSKLVGGAVAQGDVSDWQYALIAAGDIYTGRYDGDDRRDIKTDVLNAFYQGANWTRLAAQPDERVVPDWKATDVRNEADALDEEYDLTAITMLRDFADLIDLLTAAQQADR